MNRLAACLLALALATPAVAARPDKRQAAQQARIVQGVKSGELTPREAARLQHRHNQLDREIRRERAANGGHLTSAQQRDLERKQDALSRAIAVQKRD